MLAVTSTALVALATYACSTSKGPAPGTEVRDESARPPVPDSGADASYIFIPRDMTGFTPTWRPPTGLAQQQCTNAQVEHLVMCFLDDRADQIACTLASRDKANDACATCVARTDREAPLGPLVNGISEVNLNFAGCIASMEPNITNTGCGAKVQAFDECAESACPMPVTDPITFRARKGCVDAARRWVCNAFAAGAACAQELTAPGARAEVCRLGGPASFTEDATRYGKLFCGPAEIMKDGGTTDAPSGG